MEVLKWFVVVAAAIGAIAAALNLRDSYLDFRQASIDFSKDVRLRIVASMSIRRSILVFGIIVTLLVISVAGSIDEDAVIVPMVLYCSVMEIIDRSILRAVDNGTI
jgi:hypothetical protein